VRAGAPDRRPALEAQVMDWADDVAYCVHDVEDGVVAGKVPLAALADPADRAALLEVVRSAYAPDAEAGELGAALDRLTALPEWPRGYDGTRGALAALKNLTSQLIGRFCATVEQATHDAYGRVPLMRYAADLLVPRDVRLEVAVLKGVAAHWVMRADDRRSVLVRQREVIAELVELLAAGDGSALSPALRADWSAAPDDGARLRVVVDQVASLTDASAVALHQRLASR
jgi:dGTPase